jgi:hypothetical protein
MAEIQGGVIEHQAVNLAAQVELIPAGPASETSKGIGSQINRKRTALWRAGPMNGTWTTKLLATPPYRRET